MKAVLSILLFMTCLLNNTGAQFYQGKLKLKETAFALQGDSLMLRFLLDLGAVRVPPGNALALTPILFTEGQSMPLPALLIEKGGNNRSDGSTVANLTYRQIWYLEDPIPSTYVYQATVAYQSWMEGSRLLLAKESATGTRTGPQDVHGEMEMIARSLKMNPIIFSKNNSNKQFKN